MVHNIDNQILIATKKGLYVPTIKNDSIYFVQNYSLGEIFSSDSISLAQIIPYKDKFIINSEDQSVGFLSKTESDNYICDCKIIFKKVKSTKLRILTQM